jgi:hypothetical protein
VLLYTLGWLPTSRNSPTDIFTLEHATDKLSRNVGDIVPTLCDDLEERSRCSGRRDIWRCDRLSLSVCYCAIRTALKPRTANISYTCTLQLRPEISHFQVMTVETAVHAWRMFLCAVTGNKNSGSNLQRYGWFPSEDRLRADSAERSPLLICATYGSIQSVRKPVSAHIQCPPEDERCDARNM